MDYIHKLSKDQILEVLVAAEALGIQSLIMFSAAVIADIVQNIDLPAFKNFLGFTAKNQNYSPEIENKLEEQWPFPNNKDIKREKIKFPAPSPLDIAQAYKFSNETNVPTIRGFLAILDYLPLKKIHFK